MSRESALGELERELARLSKESYKHDSAVADDFMAQWILHQPEAKRAELLRDLVTWITDHAHPWHDDAALEIATRLRHEPLMVAAIREGARLGVTHDVVEGRGMASWLKFQLHLIGAIYQMPTGQGRAYLSELSESCDTASTDAQRELCLRAWITACAISDGAEEGPCLTRAIDQLRRWRNPGLSRSVLGLIGSYYSSRKRELIHQILTADELAQASL